MLAQAPVTRLARIDAQVHCGTVAAEYPRKNGCLRLSIKRWQLSILTILGKDMLHAAPVSHTRCRKSLTALRARHLRAFGGGAPNNALTATHS